MAFCTLNYFGDSIGKAATMAVIVPDGPGPYPVLYAEYPGGHTWEYWDLHIRETIAFVLKALTCR